MTIRLALFWGNFESRKYAEERFAQMEGFEIVFKGSNLRTQLKPLQKSRPHIIVISPGEGNMHISEIDLAFRKLRERLPQVRIVLHTELPFDHPFVQTAKEHGVSIVDNRLDYGLFAAGMRVAEGEQIALFAPKGHNLETFRRGLGKERF